MKLKSLLGDYLLITILAIIALAMLTIRVMYTVSNKGKIIIKETPKTIVSSPVPTGGDAEFNKKFPLWKLLPYTGEGFVVEKYTEPLVLKVSLVKGEKSVAIEKIIEWVKENGIDSETHKIVWE
jgi:hypothetical protein